jgi:hypothetical protein
MPEREGDLSVFSSVNVDLGCSWCGGWQNDIPDRAEPGHARMDAGNTYLHIVDEFSQAQKEERPITPHDAVIVFQRDRDEIIQNCGEASWRRHEYDLKNVRAEGIYEAGIEFEREEAQTPRYQTFQKVNDLLSQAIDPAPSRDQPPSAPSQ